MFNARFRDSHMAALVLFPQSLHRAIGRSFLVMLYLINCESIWIIKILKRVSPEKTGRNLI